MPKTYPAIGPLRPRGHAGFTLVELLVVIAIIALVSGIVTVGIRSALSNTVDRSTITRLETLESMMARYATADTSRGGAVGDERAKRLPSVLPNPVASGPSPVYYSTTGNASDTTTTGAVGGEFIHALDANEDGDHDDREDDILRSEVEFIYRMRAYARTQAVLRRLLADPENQKTFDSLPNQARSPATPTANSVLTQGADGIPQPQLMLDGYGNAILFVPKAGLTDLVFKDGPDHRSVVAVDGEAFWASAGADGIFGASPGADGEVDTADDIARADDNVYSRPVIIKVVPPPVIN